MNRTFVEDPHITAINYKWNNKSDLCGRYRYATITFENDIKFGFFRVAYYGGAIIDEMSTMYEQGEFIEYRIVNSKTIELNFCRPNDKIDSVDGYSGLPKILDEGQLVFGYMKKV